MLHATRGSLSNGIGLPSIMQIADASRDVILGR
jgi:hypothetical protein